MKVFDGRTGAEVRSFLAFPGYTGGVNVGAGDLDGDGFSEIVVGTASLATHVKAFDGATNQEVRSFLAFPGFHGGVRVAAGDIDGDGLAEILVGNGPGAPSHVKAIDGNLSLLSSFMVTDPQFPLGIFVA